MIDMNFQNPIKRQNGPLQGTYLPAHPPTFEEC